jgi:mono/diheme cytochrome c family protein
MFRCFLFIVALAWCAMNAACSKSPENSAAPRQETAEQIARGNDIFQTRCFVCHGRGGRGDGPSSTGLGAAPRDLTSGQWQDTITDEQIGKAIRNGAQAIGGSAAMPPNPDLNETQIQSLIRFIRSLRK